MSNEMPGHPWVWLKRQWHQTRGNAKWDTFKTGVAMCLSALWLTVFFLRQGPVWQVYGLMGIATVAAFTFLLFDSKLGKFAAAILGIAFVALFVGALISFYREQYQVSELKKSQSGSISASNLMHSPVAQVSQSTNVVVKNNSDNAKNSIDNSPNSINTIGQMGGTNTLVLKTPEPYIYETKVISINVPNGLRSYRTEVKIKVANTSNHPNVRLHHKKLPCVILSEELTNTMNLFEATTNGPITGIVGSVILMTSAKVEEKDLVFFLKEHPPTGD